MLRGSRSWRITLIFLPCRPPDPSISTWTGCVRLSRFMYISLISAGSSYPIWTSPFCGYTVTGQSCSPRIPCHIIYSGKLSGILLIGSFQVRSIIFWTSLSPDVTVIASPNKKVLSILAIRFVMAELSNMK